MPLSRTQFLVITSIESPTLEAWLDQGWLLPRVADEEVTFSDIDVARARLIRELQHDFGANDAGVDIILHLLDQMHSMRSAFDQLRLQMSGAAKP